MGGARLWTGLLFAIWPPRDRVLRGAIPAAADAADDAAADAANAAPAAVAAVAFAAAALSIAAATVSPPTSAVTIVAAM